MHVFLLEWSPMIGRMKKYSDPTPQMRKWGVNPVFMRGGGGGGAPGAQRPRALFVLSVSDCQSYHIYSPPTPPHYRVEITRWNSSCYVFYATLLYCTVGKSSLVSKQQFDGSTCRPTCNTENWTTVASRSSDWFHVIYFLLLVSRSKLTSCILFAASFDLRTSSIHIYVYY
jgi:hypothetical protein